MDYCYKHQNLNNIRVFTQFPNWRGHPLELALWRNCLFRFYPEGDVPDASHVCLWKRECEKTPPLYHLFKGTTSPINTLAQAKSFWAFHRNLASASLRPHEGGLHMLRSLPPSWVPADRWLPKRQRGNSSSAASSRPLTRWADGLSSHTASTLSHPTHHLPTGYWGKTHLMLHSCLVSVPRHQHSSVDGHWPALARHLPPRGVVSVL